jgi:WD40 repeat protein
MISPIRSMCFNDDRKTFTIVLPSQYRTYRCEPFDVVGSRDCDDVSLGAVATYSGYRFVALTGAPSSQTFGSKSVRVFDDQTGQIAFEQSFADHILTMRLGPDLIVVAMHCKIEVWNMRTRQPLHALTTGLNVHVPLALSPDSGSLVVAGGSMKQVSLHRGIGGSLASQAFHADDSCVSLVQFSADSTLFATCGYNGSIVSVWDARTVNRVAILDRGQQGDFVMAIDFSPGNEFFASCSKDATVRVWDIRRRVANAMKATPPLCTVNIGAKLLYMPRVTWMTASVLGIITIEGDFFKAKFNGIGLEVEKTPFLKRP